MYVYVRMYTHGDYANVHSQVGIWVHVCVPMCVCIHVHTLMCMYSSDYMYAHVLSTNAQLYLSVFFNIIIGLLSFVLTSSLFLKHFVGHFVT